MHSPLFLCMVTASGKDNRFKILSRIGIALNIQVKQKLQQVNFRENSRNSKLKK